MTTIDGLALYLLAPHTSETRRSQRELFLLITLAGSIIFTGSTAISSWMEGMSFTSTVIATLLCISFIAGLYFVRTNRSRLISYGIVTLYLLASLFSAEYFGASTPQILLSDVLILVISGILINIRFAIILSIIFSILTTILTFLSHQKIVFDYHDALLYCLTFTVITGIYWLFNYELEKALRRARSSESALRKQNKQLEKLVDERTSQLRTSQAQQLTQVYRFAEFGKIASGLFHDLANPLTLVSLSLQELNHPRLQNTKQALREALSGTAKLETFLQAARKQIQNQEELTDFSLCPEVEQVHEVLAYRLRKSHIKLTNGINKNLILHGNPLKFNQIVTNLVANAIDAYDFGQAKNRSIIIKAEEKSGTVWMTIQDFGSGIETQYLERIFEPLFTTKGQDKGTGLGLSVVKSIVEKDFSGDIEVYSKVGFGTIFKIALRSKKSHNTF